MPVTIKLPTPLRRHANHARTVEVTAQTVDEALAQLTETHPALRSALYSDDGNLKPFVRVFLGERDIADLDGPATVLRDGDVIAIIPPIAGA